MDYVVDSVDTVLAWLSAGIKQTTETYCDLETAENRYTLVANDGSLITIMKIHGSTRLVGNEEFDHIHDGLVQSFLPAFSRPGQSIQVLFNYDKDAAKEEITRIISPAMQTAKTLQLDLDDLFKERINFLAEYCASESLYMVLWTRPSGLTKEQNQRALKEKQKMMKENHLPPFTHSQNLIAGFKDLRNAHDSFVRATANDLDKLGLSAALLNVHQAVHDIRMTVDPEFTDSTWKPYLPGDKIPKRLSTKFYDDPSNLLYPPLHQQIMPRDAENVDMRTVRIGDRIYSSVFIELFPRDIKPFIQLFNRTLPTQIPWRISYLIQSSGLQSLKMKSIVAAILSFSSSQNRLLSSAIDQLRDIELNADDAVVKIQVATATWAPADDIRLLRTRTSQLAKALQGWGNCEVTEISGDPFGGAVSSMLGVSGSSEANSTAAPLYDVVYMLPVTRPASPWKHGAILYRSPEPIGKPWPYQPGSTLQTTWIDLIYARPGSGKSVLSNALNLGLCLQGGIKRLPRISIIDIGPSSSGLISLLKEALPHDKRHYAAYHRLRMTTEYAINPFDTQLGSRFPTPLERSFLVNFLTLLATPLGSEKPYDAIPDLAGMAVNELYKNLKDDGNPYTYTSGLEPLIDGILEEIGFVRDQHSTWWEVTDVLFLSGFTHEAMLAQRYCVPLLADAASIVRTKAVEDLFGDIVAPTGENLIDAFSRMISSAVREYPVLSRVTKFDLGEAKVVSLDLDEVAKTGGEAADRQTAVMYMLARYILAKNYYLTEENAKDMPEQYVEYHTERITELREDAKRLVYDEFHRTSRCQAVRDQVIVDMREGRKWKVQVALISQSVEDFDSVMVDFSTGIYIMDAGPAQAIKKTADIFGLSKTAIYALSTRVHGPREGGATFLAQFATKDGQNTQLLTNTIGPIELWAFSTTAEDAKLRNILYKKLGPQKARRLLAKLFPAGTATKMIEERLSVAKDQEGFIGEVDSLGVVDELANDILKAYSENPNIEVLT